MSEQKEADNTREHAGRPAVEAFYALRMFSYSRRTQALLYFNEKTGSFSVGGVI